MHTFEPLKKALLASSWVPIIPGSSELLVEVSSSHTITRTVTPSSAFFLRRSPRVV